MTLLIGVAAGVILRPHLARLIHGLTVRNAERPAPPLLPEYWATKVGQFRRLDRVALPPSVVYLGDSTTDWMHAAEFVRFDNGAVINRSINGDTTAGVLARIRTSFPPGARLCFLLIGYNDLAQGNEAGLIADRVSDILALLRGIHNVEHVVVESLLPNSKRPHLRLRDLNDRLRDVATRSIHVSFLDLYPAFLRADAPDPGLFADNGHLNAAGMVRRLALEREHVRAKYPDIGASLHFLMVE